MNIITVVNCFVILKKKFRNKTCHPGNPGLYPEQHQRGVVCQILIYLYKHIYSSSLYIYMLAIAGQTALPIY